MIDAVTHITTWFFQFQTYAKANPLIAGAVSLWGLGVVTYVCRHVPSRIFGFIERQITTTLMFTNDNVGENMQTYASFMKWFQKNSWSRISRSMSINASYEEGEEGGVVGMGDGTHFFSYKRRLFWMRRERIQQAGSNQVLFAVNITMLGRKRQVLSQLVDEFIYRPPESKLGIYVFRNGAEYWSRVADVPHRPLSTVIQPKKLKNSILSIVDEFKKSKDWYVRRGLPYKKTFLLHGAPGTGKTSLIKALASHYGMNLCVINIMAMTDSNFATALQNAPKNAFIVIEDFDSAKATHSRKPKPVKNKKTKGSSSGNVKLEVDSDRLSLTAILNALDGLVAIDDKIIFMTTNVLTQLDDAIVRKGRIDHIFEIEKLGKIEIAEYAAMMYEQPVVSIPANVKSMLGCDLQALYFQNKDSLVGFLKSLPINK